MIPKLEMIKSLAVKMDASLSSFLLRSRVKRGEEEGRERKREERGKRKEREEKMEL